MSVSWKYLERGEEVKYEMYGAKDKTTKQTRQNPAGGSCEGDTHFPWPYGLEHGQKGRGVGFIQGSTDFVIEL